MILLKQILVPIDFGEASVVALTYGRALARAFGASLHLLHVMENPFLRPTAADPAMLKAAAARHLAERLTDEDRAALHATAALETSDDPAREIVKYAKAYAIDLIVMGTHGRRGISHALSGSVAEAVFRKSHCPVIAVRSPKFGPGHRSRVIPTEMPSGTGI